MKKEGVCYYFLRGREKEGVIFLYVVYVMSFLEKIQREEGQGKGGI